MDNDEDKDNNQALQEQKNVLLRCVALLAAAGVSIPLIPPVGLEKHVPGDQFLSL